MAGLKVSRALKLPIYPDMIMINIVLAWCVFGILRDMCEGLSRGVPG